MKFPFWTWFVTLFFAIIFAAEAFGTITGSEIAWRTLNFVGALFALATTGMWFRNAYIETGNYYSWRGDKKVSKLWYWFMLLYTMALVNGVCIVVSSYDMYKTNANLIVGAACAYCAYRFKVMMNEYYEEKIGRNYEQYVEQQLSGR